MHMAARSGNQAVLLAMVNKIGAGAVQIVQNKQSKVWLVFFIFKFSTVFQEISHIEVQRISQLFGFLVEFYKRNVLERLVTSSRGMFARSY